MSCVLYGFSCRTVNKHHGMVTHREHTKSLTGSNCSVQFTHTALRGDEPYPVKASLPIFYLVPSSVQAVVGEDIFIEILAFESK